LLVCAIAAVVLSGATAWAQTPGRVEIGGGARWIGPVDFAGVAANETTLGNGTRPLFESATTLDGSIGATGSVGVWLARQFQLEFAVGYNPATMRTQITSDVEGIPDVAVDAPVTQFLLEGGAVVRPTGRQRTGFAPFLTAGAGYLRQLNDGRTLVETGRSYYFGGGLYYERATSGRRRLKASGLRLDVRALILQEGVAPDDTPRVTPAVSAGFFMRF
jgi:hypothetical protein